MEEKLEIAKLNMIRGEDLLSPFAFRSQNGVLLRKEDSKDDFRTIFARDADKIIHSDSYTRYANKTQVFSYEKNDEISYRWNHVLLVSRIARTIARALRLNEDLTEAIALGHDLGHVPFGHRGEHLLNEICVKENIGYFLHHGQSMRALIHLEGLNISVQTLDGILSHNGEELRKKYEYNPNKTKEDLLKDYNNVFNIEGYTNQIVSGTMEALVVRISDVIAYIGRDIEDAIKLKIIRREQIPEDVVSAIGNNNSEIVDTLVKDIIINSMGFPCIQFSSKIFEKVQKLQEWNYKYIYNSEQAKKNEDETREAFNKLYYTYLNKVISVRESRIYSSSYYTFRRNAI